MRILKSTFHHVGPFAHTVIDWESLSGPIIALNAVNGTGKTFCLEATTCGTCHREDAMPTQGKLSERSEARDAYIETELEYGHYLKIRHNVPKGQTGSVVVTDAEGEPAFPGTGIKQFTSWAEQHLPRRDVLEVTTLSAQGAKGFMGLSSTERIKIILRCAGQYKTQRAAELARKNANGCQDRLDAMEIRITDARKGWVSVEDALQAIDVAEEAAATADDAERRAQLELAAAAEASEGSATARLRYEEQLAAYRDIQSRRDLAKCALQSLERRLAAVDTEAANVKAQTASAAQTAAEKALAEAEGLDKGLALRKQASDAAKAARDRIQADSTEARSKLATLEKKIANNKGLLAKTAEIQAVIDARIAAIKWLPGLEASERDAKQVVADARAKLDELKALTLVGAEGRIVALRAGLTSITDAYGGGDGDNSAAMSDIANATLAGDDYIVFEAAEHPAKVKLATEALTAATAAEARATAARQSAATASTKRHEHEENLAQAKTRIAEYEQQIKELKATIERLASELAAAPVPEKVPEPPDLAKLRATVERARNAAAEAAAALTAVQTTVRELEPAIEAKRIEANGLSEKFSALQEPVAPGEGPNVSALQEAVETKKEELSRAVVAVGEARQKLQHSRDTEQHLEELEAQREQLELELADWKLEAEQCKAIANLEVDAAGPELTECCNHILRTCHGPRFSVEVRTVREKKDGSGETDDCQMLVHDNVTGKTKEGRQFSGGEKAFLNEALSFTLAIFACRRAGIGNVTLFRDESGRDFDKENAIAYMKMLRLVASDPIIQIDKIILVTHDPELLQLCDSVVDLAEEMSRTQSERAA